MGRAIVWETYHRDIKQSVKKKLSHAEEQHFPHNQLSFLQPLFTDAPSGDIPFHSLFTQGEIHTQRTARKTSVTLNRFSTLQGAPISSLLPTSSSSPRNVKAHLSPHQTAGAVLKARQRRRGKCQCFSTPSRTATRGCRTEFLWSGWAG